jgi:NF-X1-type zinc finger protein NFXL1
LGNTEQYLIDAFKSESNICLICIEPIEANDAIWSCNKSCFAHFHINCIQNWIKDGSYLNTTSTTTLNINSEIPWNCPKCRADYQRKKDYPSVYLCYCSKVKNPVHDLWSVPHSCNQICGKIKNCDHKCLMICHPGPCPPCPKMIKTTCYCKKSNEVVKRCSNKEWSCNKTCNKLLTCKQHLCEMKCHNNECNACEKTSIQFCLCKTERKLVSCKSTQWQCEKVFLNLRNFQNIISKLLFVFFFI